MDPILQTLFSWQFVIFSMAIAAIVFVVRLVLEYLMSTYTSLNKEAKLWNDLILPTLPVAIGPTAAYLIASFPYPDGLTTDSSRIIFGLVAGLLSTLLYRVFKALLIQKIGTIIPADTVAIIPPNPVTTTVTVANTPDATVPSTPPVAPPAPAVAIPNIPPPVNAPTIDVLDATTDGISKRARPPIDLPDNQPAKKTRPKKSKLTKNQMTKIFKLFSRGISNKEIANEFKITLLDVIKLKKHWKNKEGK
jgi:DNA-binding CsgD family transcriptional regulator